MAFRNFDEGEEETDWKDEWGPPDAAIGRESSERGIIYDLFIDNSRRSVRASIWYMVFIVFLASIGYSITLPSVWLYLNDMGVTNEGVMGLNIGIYCLGQFLSANFFGWLSNRVSVTIIVIICLFLDMTGQWVYAFSNTSWALLFSRFFSGLGAGTVTVSRGYVSSKVSKEERLGAMSLISAAQAGGFVFGPAFGAILSLIDFQVGPFDVNEFTSPAYLQIILCLGGIIVALLSFRNLGVLEKANVDVGSGAANEGEVDKPLLDVTGNDDVLAEELIVGHTRHDEDPGMNKKGMSLCLVMFFVITLVFALFETVITPVTADYYDWGTAANGVLFGSVALGTMLTLPILSWVVKNDYCSDRLALIFGMTIMAFSFCIMYSYWQDPMPLGQFIVGVIGMVGPGYMYAQVELLSIYSKLIGTSKPGSYIGWISSSGSLARIVGPIIAGYMLAAGGLDVVVTTIGGIVSCAFIILMVLYDWLKPTISVKTEGMNIDFGH